MDQRLRRNFEVIQYLVKNASPEQLGWRKDEDCQSLAQVLGQLRDVEKWHAQVGMAGGDISGSPPEQVAYANGDPFAAYARYRRQTTAWLQNISPTEWQRMVSHHLFGEVTLKQLVDCINETDCAYIRQIENIIHRMPLNPLVERALHEISEYHRHYQPYLRQAASLLDIGVGPGLALQHVMQQNPHLACVGIDLRDLRLPGVKVPLQVYEGHTLPFAAGQFDVTLMFYVLHHCRHPYRLIEEAVRVTRQTIIVIEEFHRPGADPASLDLTERQSHRALGIPPDLPYHLFDRPELERMLRECNLIELACEVLPSQTTRPVEKYLYVMQGM
ncbi:MAG: methyltransferase domain-containing protein [Anaerolineae bacterium]|nr:methyltransferase domain-containing protein [Anaerolineae bacterium]